MKFTRKDLRIVYAAIIFATDGDDDVWSELSDDELDRARDIIEELESEVDFGLDLEDEIEEEEDLDDED